MRNWSSINCSSGTIDGKLVFMKASQYIQRREIKCLKFIKETSVDWEIYFN